MFSVFSFVFHAQKPNREEVFDGFAVSIRCGICSGCGAGVVLDAIGDGPSLGKADAPAISLSALAWT